MKKACNNVLVLWMLAMLASCAPQAFYVSSQMRAPSQAGVNLAGKSVAVVYQTDGSSADTLFTACFANGFANKLEEDYFDSRQEVGFFTVPASEGVDYACKDSMVSLVMQTGKDVVFLIGTPVFGELEADDAVAAGDVFRASVKVPFSADLHAYDSMNSADKVFDFRGEKTITSTFLLDKACDSKEVLDSAWVYMDTAAQNAGVQAAGHFSPVWKEENFLVVYYEPARNAWTKASECAWKFDWKGAVENWMTLLDTGNAEKKSCLCYNIALGCFMLGQPVLAYEWLDQSDSEKPLSISKGLRKQIFEYSGIQYKKAGSK